MTISEFQDLLQTIADGWNQGLPLKSVECFIDEATYIEPPDKQFFQGRSQLYEYFGGDTAKAGQMSMKWHNIFLNEETQVGGGEYTFEMNDKIHHGVVVVELDNKKIRTWREYDIISTLSHDDFLGLQGKTFNYTIKELESNK